jgi:hypothetical protein
MTGSGGDKSVMELLEGKYGSALPQSTEKNYIDAHRMLGSAHNPVANTTPNRHYNLRDFLVKLLPILCHGRFP